MGGDLEDRADGAAGVTQARRHGRQRLTDWVVEAAHGLGFDACAVAPVERLPAIGRLREWLHRDMHGSMGWMARNVERRSDPREVVPGARSVVVAAMSYWTGDDACHDPEAGNISRYAWGDEYHEVLGDAMEALWEQVQELAPGCHGRWYVDTGPVLEKAWAERAGLGWIGKHTNLIDPGLGSWIFLGALVTDLDLAAGDAHPDRCGTCTACIEVCPTRAIVAPYVLDARRCISYLNIENRGPIPREHRAAMGNRIFGCDDCQDVCPWNRFARLSRQAQRFAPRQGNVSPDLVELLELDEEEFRERFRGSPVRRAKHRGFRRNVAVALGNSGDRRAVAPLGRALDDDEPLVRGHAAWALGELGGEAAAAALARRRRMEDDGWVVEELDLARQRLGRATEGPC